MRGAAGPSNGRPPPQREGNAILATPARVLFILTRGCLRRDQQVASSARLSRTRRERVNPPGRAIARRWGAAQDYQANPGSPRHTKQLIAPAPLIREPGVQNDLV